MSAPYSAEDDAPAGEVGPVQVVNEAPETIDETTGVVAGAALAEATNASEDAAEAEETAEIAEATAEVALQETGDIWTRLGEVTQHQADLANGMIAVAQTQDRHGAILEQHSAALAELLQRGSQPELPAAVIDAEPESAPGEGDSEPQPRHWTQKTWFKKSK